MLIRLLLSKERNHLLILFIAWALVMAGMFMRFGVVTNLEAEKYIYEADFFLQTGHFSTGNYIFYSVQILLIALSKTTGSFPWLVIFVQLTASACATWLFYKTISYLTGRCLPALVASLFFTVFIYYQQYHTHLFTESLFFSGSIIYTALLFRIRKLNLAAVFMMLTGLSFLYFTRPLGVFFLPATICFVLFRFFPARAWILLCSFAVAGTIILYFLLNKALRSGGEFDFVLPYIDERIICGVPTIAGKNVLVIPGEKNSIEGLWYIITHYPDIFWRLSVQRLLAFWGIIRPYYSTAHNVFAGGYFYLLYILIITGGRRLWKQYRAESAYFFCSLFFLMITVVLSCDEWHNRFILAQLPFLIWMACLVHVKKKPDAAN